MTPQKSTVSRPRQADETIQKNTPGAEQKGEAKEGDACSQIDKFMTAALELGADEDETRFDVTLKKVASAPTAKGEPKPETKKPAK